MRISRLVDALSEDLWNGLSPKQETVFEKLNAPPSGGSSKRFSRRVLKPKFPSVDEVSLYDRRVTPA